MSVFCQLNEGFPKTDSTTTTLDVCFSLFVRCEDEFRKENQPTLIYLILEANPQGVYRVGTVIWSWGCQERCWFESGLEPLHFIIITRTELNRSHILSKRIVLMDTAINNKLVSSTEIFRNI